MESLPRFIRGADNATVYDTSKGFLDPISDPQDFYRRSGSNDIAGNTTVVPDVYKYLTDFYHNQGASIYKPTLDNTLNQLNLNEQGLNTSATDINRNADTLGETLRKTAAGSSTGLKENFNNLGLLQSGLTASGLGDIQTTLNKNIGNAEADRASQLANVALQRAGIGVQRSQAQVANQQNINDYVTKLIQQSEQAKADATSPAQTIDLGDRVALINKAGQILGYIKKGATPGSGGSSNDTSALIAAIMQALGGGSGGNTSASASNPADDFANFTSDYPGLSIAGAQGGNLQGSNISVQGGPGNLQGTNPGLQGGNISLQDLLNGQNTIKIR